MRLGYAHAQLSSFYLLSTFGAFHMTKNTRLSTPAQLQCLHSRAWEPGNEATFSICFQYLLSVSAFSTHFQYLLSVPAFSTCFQYLLSVPAFSTCFQYLLSVSAFSICFQYLLSVPAFSTCFHYLLSVPISAVLASSLFFGSISVSFLVPFHFHFHILASYPGPFEKSFSPIFQMGLGTRLLHICTLHRLPLEFSCELM